ncbi:MBG domain-containing protein [Romboutsia sp. 1001713B170207_170306_H8]|uniref:MBG domain-containing protein n=1 Tax=Romboutsia sp. 1001713B170207_170306_H8 TaxID=2787112 RepID=UPI00189C0254|nr:MBG domain-containing protein [Romboutsia sp. 1001713B170207_170306_H8]
MHKRGVSLVLSLVITANLLPVNAIKSFADEVSLDNGVVSEEIVESKQDEFIEESNDINIDDINNIEVNEDEITEVEVKDTIENEEVSILSEEVTATRKVTANIKVENSQFGKIDGLSSDEETIELLTNYINVKDHYILGGKLYSKTTGDIDIENSDTNKKIYINPKSGYKVSHSLGTLLTQASVDTEEDGSKILTINPIDSDSWNKNLLVNISGDIKISYSLKGEEDREELTIVKDGEGTISQVGDDLYFHEENKAYMDKGSQHTFKLEPKEGMKVGSVTLYKKPVVVDENNQITVGGGELKVEFIEDKEVEEVRDLNIEIIGNGHIVINNKNINASENIQIEAKKEHNFTVEADEENFIVGVSLNGLKLVAEDGVYTIPSDFNGGDLKVEFSEKLETKIVMRDLNVAYDGIIKTLTYKVVDSNNNVIKDENGNEDRVVKFYKKNWLGIKEEIYPVNEGSYEFSVSFDGNETCKPSSYNGVFNIYDAREEATIELDQTQSTYDGTEKEVNYVIKGKDGEIIETGKVEFTKVIIPGLPGIQYKPVDAGSYEYTVNFKGNKNYKPQKFEGTFEINKCNAKIKVGNTVAEYNGNAIRTNISVDYNLGYIGIYAGVNYDLSGSVYVDLNLGDDAISKTIMEAINKINIGTMDDLKKALHDLAPLLSTLGVDLTDVIKALDYLPGDLRVSLGAPKAAGAYVVTGVVLDKNSNTTVGVGSLLIHRNLSKVVFTSDSLEDKAVVKVGQSYSHKAVFEGSEKSAKMVYSGVTKAGKLYHSEIAPAEEGMYVVTAYSYDDLEYTVGLAMRSFAIVKEIAHVDFSEDSLADKAVIKVGQEYTHSAIVRETKEDATIVYSGITLLGKKYKSTEKPTDAGVYVATAYDCGDKAHTAALAMRTFTIIREQNKVEFTQDSLSDKAVVKVGTNYKHEAVYKGSTNKANIRYTGVAIDGSFYCSTERPIKEGIYVATAYSYSDTQFTSSLAMRSFAISKYTTTVDLNADDVVYNGEAYKPYTIVKDKNGEVVENAELKYTYYSGGTKLDSAPIEAGKYTVVATFMGDSSHIKSMAVTQFVIEKAELTVNIDDVSKVVGEEDPEFTYSVEGLVGSDTVEFELVREAGEDVGEYNISVVDKEFDNYIYTVNEGSLTITEAEKEPEKPGDTEKPDEDDLDKPGDNEPEKPGDTTKPGSTDTQKTNNNQKPESHNPKTSDPGIGGFASIGVAALTGLFLNRRRKR